MSRSALTRNAIQKSLALRSQLMTEEEEDETTRRVKENELPIHGNEHTYNLNSLLYQNILQSAYFHELYKFKTYHEVVDEIYYRVDHAEPLSAGTSRIPSTCFCLLMKFFTMRLTLRQMQGLLKHKDSPYIRCVGFLYLRYTCDPEKLWEWFEPYLDDPEEFNASSNPNDKTTLGEWLRRLLEDINYFGTILPRIPKKILDSIKVKLLLHTRRKEREKENLVLVPHLKPGTHVRALYADDENEPAMYDAVIDSVEENHQYWVTFPEYGNSEKVSLGDIEYKPPERPNRRSSSPRPRSRSRSRESNRSRARGKSSRRRRSRSHSRSRSSRSRSRSHSRRRRRHSRSRSRSTSRRRHSRRAESPPNLRTSAGGGLAEELLEQVREKERRQAEAVGRDYASRPASYKGSLSLKIDRYTNRRRSRSPQRRKEVVVTRTQPKVSSGDEKEDKDKPSVPVSKVAQERLQKLRAMYGDASAPRQEISDED